MNPWLISIPIAYLLGSIPFGFLLVLLFRKEDIRATGSGNIGATNVARSGAKGLGMMTLLLDLGKAFLGVRIAQHFAPGVSDLAVGAAVAAILGHVFPIWLGFRGGKGVASALGVLLALNWQCAVCILGVFVVIVLLTRYVSLASIMAAATLPFFAFVFFLDHPDGIVVGGLLLITVIILLKHHANVGRLLSGTEARFGGKSIPKAAA